MISGGAWVVLSPGCPTFRSTISSRWAPPSAPFLGVRGESSRVHHLLSASPRSPTFIWKHAMSHVALSDFELCALMDELFPTAGSLAYARELESLEPEDVIGRAVESSHLLLAPVLRCQVDGLTVTSEQYSAFTRHRSSELARRETARQMGRPTALSITGAEATIAVRGLLSEQLDVIAYILGQENTLYSDIAEAILAAESDPAVKHITFDVVSGGGTVAGLRTATQAISTMTKPRTVVSSFAASAAYWLATAIGRIEASHDLAEFGSLGVATRSMKVPGVVDITSTDAPNKRPDPSTEEGRAAIRAELDAIHERFVADVATGRSKTLGRMVTAQEVNQTFGRGGMLIASEALSRGMIDGIRTGAAATSGSTMHSWQRPAAASSSAQSMTDAELAAEMDRVFGCP